MSSIRLIKPTYILLVSTLVLLIWSLVSRPHSLNGDSAMYVYAGNLILSGQKPFVDFFDVSPPFIMYFSAGSNYIANYLNVSPDFFYKLLFAAICIVLIMIISMLCRRAKLIEKENIPLFLVLNVFVLMSQIFHYTFGQRDVYFGFAAAAYLLIRYIRCFCPGVTIFRWMAFSVGLFFAVGLCFKPVFLIFALSIEFFVFLNRPKQNYQYLLNFEIVISFAFVLLNLLIMLNLPEPAFSNFWVRHIPMVAKYYSSYNFFTPADSLFRAMGSTIFLGPFLLLFLTHYYKNLDSFGRMLAVGTGSMGFIFLVQMKWFPYHLSPFETFFYYVLFFVLINANSKQQPIRPPFAARFGKWVGIVSMLNLIWHGYLFHYEAGYSGNKENPYWHTQKLFDPYVNRGDAILSLTPSNANYYNIALVHGLVIGSRYLIQYPISFYGTKRFASGKLIFNDLDKELNDSESRYFRELSEDVKKFQPKIIWFYTRQNDPPAGLPQGFPVLEYLDKVGFLKEIYQKYHKIETRPEIIAFVSNISLP